ncbi:MAG: semialdehyde dehydrogenase [Planctomycetes bacterium]|nr:semialdehyde dehydrogenase [Planctomycetota bacterium]
MAIRIALLGAGGKMGTRISEKLRDAEGFELLPVESGAAGLDQLRRRGLTPAAAEEAVRTADAVVLAIPDVAIAKEAARVVTWMRSGAMLVCLDPAAPHGEAFPRRDDIACLVTHPCHPPVINDETDPEAKADCFGGKAKQHVVCALMRGSEADYDKGEKLVRAMFAPVMRVHRITVEQMAILEPALSETVVLTFMFAMREAMEEAVRAGVPAEAARDFLLGHLHVDIGILFGFIDARVSEGAKLAARRGMERLLRPDWKDVFRPDSVLEQVRAITRAAG